MRCVLLLIYLTESESVVLKDFNEIDLICEDEIEKKAEIIEIKRNADRIDYESLEEKADVLMKTTAAYKGWQVICKGLSMEEM